jgi:CBS domain-containing protein
MNGRVLDKNELFEAVKFHPFFRGLEQLKAIELLEKCEQKSYGKNEMILSAHKKREGLLLLLKGVAEVYVEHNDHYEVLEVIQKGELVGFSSLADFLGVSRQHSEQKSEEMVSVRAIEQVTALYIPFSVILERWDDQNVHDYLLTQVALRLKDIYSSFAEQMKLARRFGDSSSFVLRIQDVMTPSVINVNPDATVQEAAKKMTDYRVSSVLITENEKLKGIITEKDLVERVLSKSKDYSEKVVNVMTKNPVTISRFSYYYEAFSTMIFNGIKHLPVVDDEKVVGIVTLSDLLRKKSENMMRTIQELDNAEEETLPKIKNAIYEVLEMMLHDQVPTFHSLKVITKLYDRLVSRCVVLAIKAIGEKPPSRFCLYQMGSSGRGEQFLLTDQDHFLVYEGEHEGYFKRLGNEIVRIMEIAGYERCKGKMMASEPEWRGTLESWKERLREWMLQSTNENLLLAHNFFSYRFVYGDELLHESFEAMIKEQMKRAKIFLFRLAEIEKQHEIPSLEQPIRSLFRLERKTIDMKKDILFPYHHSVQILSLVHGIVSGTPMDRIERLKDQKVLSEHFSKDVQAAAGEVLKIYMKHKWQQHKLNQPSTSVISFTHMTTREKDELMLSLKTLKQLQHHVFSHF